MSSFPLISGILARARGITLAAVAVASLAGPQALAVELDPSNVFLSSYNAARLNNAGVAANRANAFTILTNGVIDQTAAIDRIDTWNSDNANTLPSHTVYDFVGLQYDSSYQFDSITIHLGNQFVDGGDWEAQPKVYILKNPALVGGEVEPNLSPNWVEISGFSETTGHVFNPIVTPGPGGTINFDLSSVPAADRTGWGWAVGGVDGNQRTSDSNWNFMSFTEVLAEGVPAPVPQKVTASTLRPTNVVTNSYHSPGIDGDDLTDGRGHVFKSITNGVINNAAANDGFDTFQGDGAGTITDFVGLQYGTLNVFDNVTIQLANQFGDGGDWDSKPKVYILKNPVDTNTAAPESDPTNWLELDAPETTGHTFSPLVTPGVGGMFTLDLSGFTADQRTGWGIAVGGVDGNANGAGVVNFVSIAEMQVGGSVIPGPYDLSLQVNTTTGEVKIMNNTALDINLDYYEVASANGSLDLSASGWDSLQDPTLNTPAFPSGDGTGNGWEELGNLDENLAAEFFLQGSTTMEDGTSVSLGNLFAGGTEDLFFRYGIGGAFIDGVVEYISGPNPAGDFSGDGAVDGDDLSLLLGNWGQTVPPTPAGWDGIAPTAPQVDADELSALLGTWGQGVGAAALNNSAAAVPEPGTLAGGILCLLLLGITTRRNAA